MDPSSLRDPRLPLLSLLHGRPQAVARLAGGEGHPGLSGTVRFYQTKKGVVVWAEVVGLPRPEQPCGERVFGFHIHQGSDCGGNTDGPFGHAMSHYDPHGCDHPHHAGDLPPLFGSDGAALSLFLTRRFSVDEVIGKVVIIHDRPDDFTTQPSGSSGAKIACGVIQRLPDPRR